MPVQPQLFASLPVANISGTRTSDYWANPPGNIDKLNLRIIWPRVNTWGIPELDPEHSVPTSLAAWHDPRAIGNVAEAGGAIHFFLDDYRFEAAWNNPRRGLERVRRTGFALTPDFSLWRDMPLAAQIWQVYRSRWVGALWQYSGIKVIPTASWSGPESYRFCFDGIPHGVPVAVSAVGIRDADGQNLFADGLAALIDRTSPSRLLVYGQLPDGCGNLDLPPVTTYPTFWQQRKPKTGA